MFTGIITDVGSVRSIIKNGDWRFEFNTAYETAKIDLGASIACSGCSLTVVDRGPGWFAAEVSAETMSKTICSTWEIGSLVNFERPLKAGDELGGHIVSGHVDGITKDKKKEALAKSTLVDFYIPKKIEKFICEKGSVSIDGVSLTINRVYKKYFSINIIPHTNKITTLGKLKKGDKVNLEIDLLARYISNSRN